MSYEYYDKLENEPRHRYEKKLESVGLKECPYRLPKDVWVDDPTRWPEVEYPDVYEYLINTPGVYTMEAMKNRKSLEAYNQFHSGWVGPVLLYKTTCFILTASVLPSQRVNDTPHQPWVAVNKDGSVVCAHCNCMAGLGESCSHIGAVLFKVEAAVRLGYTREACTDKVCEWNNDFVKKVKPAMIRDVKFYQNPEKVKHPTWKFTPSTGTEREKFLASIAGPNVKTPPVCLSLFEQHAHPFHHTAPVPRRCKLPASLTTYHDARINPDDIPGKVKKMMDLSLSEEQLDMIEDATKLQADSLLWKDMRIGRITASTAHDVLHTNQDAPAKSIMKKICFPPHRSSISTKSTSSSTTTKVSPASAMQWGTEKEADALKAYEEKLRDSHTNLKVNRRGLRLSSQHHFLGASADAVTTCDCHGTWLVEVKCPFKHRDAMELKAMTDDKDFCLDIGGYLKVKHRYFTQVQMQMHIYNMDSCHFVVWNPNICHVVQVDRVDFSGDIKKLVKFFENHIAPELITHNIQNMPSVSGPCVSGPSVSSNNDQQSVSSPKTYCYCKQTCDEEDSDMIGCDGAACPYEWVHFKCAKLKRAPKGTWHCKVCRKKSSKKIKLS